MQSTAHRNDFIESEQRRAIDLVVSILEKQGLRDESVAIRGATNASAVTTAVQKMMIAGAAPTRTRAAGLGASDLERERAAAPKARSRGTHLSVGKSTLFCRISPNQLLS